MPKMPKTPKSSKTPQSSTTSHWKLSRIILLLVGLAGTFVFSLRLALQPEINLDSLENEMSSAATKIIFLDSEPSDFDSQAPTRAYGEYLALESTARFAELLTLSDIKLALDLLGLITSITIFALAFRSRP